MPPTDPEGNVVSKNLLSMLSFSKNADFQYPVLENSIHFNLIAILFLLQVGDEFGKGNIICKLINC